MYRNSTCMLYEYIVLELNSIEYLPVSILDMFMNWLRGAGQGEGGREAALRASICCLKCLCWFKFRHLIPYVNGWISACEIWACEVRSISHWRYLISSFLIDIIGICMLFKVRSHCDSRRGLEMVLVPGKFLERMKLKWNNLPALCCLY